MLHTVIREGFMHHDHLKHFETVTRVEELSPHLKGLSGT